MATTSSNSKIPSSPPKRIRKKACAQCQEAKTACDKSEQKPTCSRCNRFELTCTLPLPGSQSRKNRKARKQASRALSFRQTDDEEDEDEDEADQPKKTKKQEVIVISDDEDEEALPQRAAGSPQPFGNLFALPAALPQEYGRSSQAPLPASAPSRGYFVPSALSQQQPLGMPNQPVSPSLPTLFHSMNSPFQPIPSPSTTYPFYGQNLQVSMSQSNQYLPDVTAQRVDPQLENPQDAATFPGNFPTQEEFALGQPQDMERAQQIMGLGEPETFEEFINYEGGEEGDQEGEGSAF